MTLERARVRPHRGFGLDRLVSRIELERITAEVAVVPIALVIASHPNPERYGRSSLRSVMRGTTPVTPSIAEAMTRRTEPGDQGCGNDGIEEHVAPIVVAGCRGPRVLPLIDRAFDGVAFLAAVLVEAWRSPTGRPLAKAGCARGCEAVGVCSPDRLRRSPSVPRRPVRPNEVGERVIVCI